MKAYLKSYRQSPRKVRLVASLVRGKNVEDARVLLDTISKRAAMPLRKLLDSAVANAGRGKGGAGAEHLYIKEFSVNNGIVGERFMPRARGSAFPIKKRTSNVMVVLEERAEKKDVKKKSYARKQTEKSS